MIVLQQINTKKSQDLSVRKGSVCGLNILYTGLDSLQIIKF